MCYLRTYSFDLFLSFIYISTPSYFLSFRPSGLLTFTWPYFSTSLSILFSPAFLFSVFPVDPDVHTAWLVVKFLCRRTERYSHSSFLRGTPFFLDSGRRELPSNLKRYLLEFLLEGREEFYSFSDNKDNGWLRDMRYSYAVFLHSPRTPFHLAHISLPEYLH